MKLNSFGKAIYHEWNKRWDDIVEEELKKENVGETGWSAVDEKYVHNINDEVCLMIMVYGADVIYALQDDIHPFIKMDEEWRYGVTKREFLKLCLPYLDMENEKDINIARKCGYEA